MTQTVEINDKLYTLAGPITRGPVPGFSPSIRQTGQVDRDDVSGFSQWEITKDLIDGLGVRDPILPEDSRRFWDSTVQTHFRRGIKLPPQQTTYTQVAGLADLIVNWLTRYRGDLIAISADNNDSGGDAEISISELSAGEWQATASIGGFNNGDATAEGLRLGQPAEWQGTVIIPFAGNPFTSLGQTSFAQYDATGTIQLVTFESGNATSIPLAFFNFRGGAALAAIWWDDSTNEVVVSDWTPGDNISSATEIIRIHIPEDGTLMRPATPIQAAEGYDANGVRQLYLVVADTVYLIDWDNSIVSVVYRSDSNFPSLDASAVSLSPEYVIQRYGNDMVVNEGSGSVLRISPDGQITQIGPILDDGTPVEAGLTSIQVIRDLIIAADDDRAYLYNGLGWHSLGDPTLALDIGVLFFDSGALYMVPRNNEHENITSLDVGQLHRDTETGARSYASSGYLETYRFHGGFPERAGTAYRLVLRANGIDSGNEEILVEYKTDTVGTYTTIGTFSTGTTAEFILGSSNEGIAFKWIQLKFTLSRGATATNTPDLIGAVLEYDKLSKLYERFNIPIHGPDTGRPAEDIENELFPLQDGDQQDTLVSLKYGHVDTMVRITSVTSVEAMERTSSGGQRAAEYQSLVVNYAVVAEERH